MFTKIGVCRDLPREGRGEDDLVQDIFTSDALAGKSIFVTGGGSGLGREIAFALAAKDAVVHICGGRANVLSETAEALRATFRSKVHTHICDLRDAAQVDAMVAAIGEVGALAGLVKNAAANFIALTKDLSPRGLRAVPSAMAKTVLHAVTMSGVMGRQGAGA